MELKLSEQIIKYSENVEKDFFQSDYIKRGLNTESKEMAKEIAQRNQILVEETVYFWSEMWAQAVEKTESQEEKEFLKKGSEQIKEFTESISRESSKFYGTQPPKALSAASVIEDYNRELTAAMNSRRIGCSILDSNTTGNNIDGKKL